MSRYASFIPERVLLAATATSCTIRQHAKRARGMGTPPQKGSRDWRPHLDMVKDDSRPSGERTVCGVIAPPKPRPGNTKQVENFWKHRNKKLRCDRAGIPFSEDNSPTPSESKDADDYEDFLNNLDIDNLTDSVRGQFQGNGRSYCNGGKEYKKIREGLVECGSLSRCGIRELVEAQISGSHEWMMNYDFAMDRDGKASVEYSGSMEIYKHLYLRPNNVDGRSRRPPNTSNGADSGYSSDGESADKASRRNPPQASNSKRKAQTQAIEQVHNSKRQTPRNPLSGNRSSTTGNAHRTERPTHAVSGANRTLESARQQPSHQIVRNSGGQRTSNHLRARVRPEQGSWSRDRGEMAVRGKREPAPPPGSKADVSEEE
ncbi:hypothetical protein D6D21_05790 [Aureobasidium pullulans]|uniref:Uncharacterized protein n=1 Tax=Aureobasidium pullulans TaxID=5580 RepID=A0AB74IVH5_AURPU|nr:hypothetical protein D6D21_05790 [Aureobasidium pullulans]